MSLQWTLIATFLYAEIVVVLLLVLPIISPQTWNKFFKSKFMQAIRANVRWYFGALILILVLFLMDSVREIRKYSNIERGENVHAHLETEMQAHMRLFRAERNMYITGFALFLCFVIRRLVNLLALQAHLIAKYEAALKQAQSAVSAATDYMHQVDEGEVKQNMENESHASELNELKKEMKMLKEKLETEKKDKEAITSQAESVSKEYDRLLKEHAKLQSTLSTNDDKKRE